MSRQAADVESGYRYGVGTYLRGIFRILIIVLVLAVVLFASAGRIDWPAAWMLISLYAVYLFGVMLWGIKKAPDLLLERGRVADNVKRWDKVINAVYAVLVIAELVIAGLDARRFGWSSTPFVLQVLGGLGLIMAFWVIWRTMVENAYLSRWARIQDDRGQQVIRSGPYALVRHPMYAAIILLVVSMALELGSYWSLLPASLIVVLFVVRTILEDRMLHEELAGYREYASRVRSRLVPGIW